METEPSFNLTAAVEHWAGELMHTGTFSQDNIEELKSHIIDQTLALEQAGLATDEAFYIALKRIGNINILKQEFRKENALALFHARLMLLLNGVVLFFLLKTGAEVGNLLLALAGWQFQWSEMTLFYMDAGVKAAIFIGLFSLLLLLLWGKLRTSKLLQHLLFPNPLLAVMLVALVVLSQLGVWYLSPLVRHEISREVLYDLNKNTVFFSIYFFGAIAAGLMFLAIKNKRSRPAMA